MSTDAAFAETDRARLLAELKARMVIPVAFGRGDGATHAGSPDRGEPGWRPGPRDLYSPPLPNGVDLEDLIKLRSHDFQ